MRVTFLNKVTFQGGSQVLKILRRVARKRRSDRSGTFSGRDGGEGGVAVVGTR